MRIWSLHPRYLDTKGLVALWRETLLAKHVLLGKTKGYTHHPQLQRFRWSTHPVISIDSYLQSVYSEAESRGYHFSREKVDWTARSQELIPVTDGQIEYETTHLLRKLERRDPERYVTLIGKTSLEIHPLFTPIPWPIESWEILP